MEESRESSSGTRTSHFGEEAFDELVLVFRYLNFQELSVCRTVSKLWYDASLPHWLEAAPPKKLWEEPQDDEGNERATIADFLERFRGSAGGGGGDDDEFSEVYNFRAARQFRKFHLHFASADSDEKVESQFILLTHFLTKCGPFITHLELQNINLENPDAFQDVVYSKYTPNMQRLMVYSCNWNPAGKSGWDVSPVELHFSRIDKSLSRKVGAPVFKSLFANFGYNNFEEDDYGRLPVAWVDFLSHFSSLEKISILYISNEDLLDVVDAILQIRRADKTKLALSSMEFKYDGWEALSYNPEGFLGFFRDSQLPLEDLDIHIFRDTKAPLVFELINLHSTSLKKLRLRVMDAEIVWNAGLELPFVEHLHKLEIRGKIISSLIFFKKFPNLEVLLLSGSRRNLRKLISATTEEEMLGVVIPSLKKFTYDYKEICGPEEVRKIAKWMPHLTSLELAVTNDGLRVACESWPSMESMNLAVGLVGDDNCLERRQSMREYIPVDIPKNISQNSGGGSRNTKFKLTPYDDVYNTRRRLVASSLEFVLQ